MTPGAGFKAAALGIFWGLLSICLPVFLVLLLTTDLSSARGGGSAISTTLMVIVGLPLVVGFNAIFFGAIVALGLAVRRAMRRVLGNPDNE